MISGLARPRAVHRRPGAGVQVGCGDGGDGLRRPAGLGQVRRHLDARGGLLPQDVRPLLHGLHLAAAGRQLQHLARGSALRTRERLAAGCWLCPRRRCPRPSNRAQALGCKGLYPGSPAGTCQPGPVEIAATAVPAP